MSQEAYFLDGSILANGDVNNDIAHVSSGIVQVSDTFDLATPALHVCGIDMLSRGSINRFPAWSLGVGNGLVVDLSFQPCDFLLEIREQL